MVIRQRWVDVGRATVARSCSIGGLNRQSRETCAGFLTAPMRPINAWELWCSWIGLFGSSTSLNEYGSLHAAGFRAVTSNDLVFLYVPLADFPAPVGAKPGTLSGFGQRDFGSEHRDQDTSGPSLSGGHIFLDLLSWS
jgi:hypothetical protein